jgi:hypothetical protein
MGNDTEDQIRADERHRLAALFEEHAETIADFAADKERLVGLMALMLRLGRLSPSVEEWADRKAPA